MDKSSSESSHPKKKKNNTILGLFIVVLLFGISVGMYLLNTPQIFNPRAASDTFSKCGPSGHCTDYGWNDNNGYTRVTDNCYVALYKCNVSKWTKAIAVGCQKNTSDSSKDTAYYAEIHKKTASNPNPQIWDKVVSGTDGNGHLKSFAPPQFCGVWQIDVGPPCNFSFHSGGNRRESMCKIKATPTPTNKPTKTPTPTPKTTPTPTLTPTITPTPPSCPVPSPVTNLKIVCPICSNTQ